MNTPVLVRHNYFGFDDDYYPDSGVKSLRYVFGPINDIEVNTNDENCTFIRRVRQGEMTRRKYTEDNLSASTITESYPEGGQDGLLMGRFIHL